MIEGCITGRACLYEGAFTVSDALEARKGGVGMLTKRVIPCLDVKDGRVVKGVNFVSLRDAGDPVELAAAYDCAGADEVIFLDITATSDNRATTIDMAARAACELSIPYTVGRRFSRPGGHAGDGCRRGQTRSRSTLLPCAIQTLSARAAAAFGSQAVICAIDAKRVGGTRRAGCRRVWEVYTAGGPHADGY